MINQRVMSFDFQHLSKHRYYLVKQK